MALLEMAVAKGTDMEQLSKLMDLQERWEKKEAKKTFLEALSKFQQMVPVLKKTRTANIASQKGSYSYKFADLGSIAQQIKKPLHVCGLSYRWEFKEEADKMTVSCLLSHKDGHTEVTSMEAGKDDTGGKNAIQQKGSTHTYLERYTLIGALGLSTADEDNDGKGGPAANKRSSSSPYPFKKQMPNATDPEYLEQWRDVVKQVKSRTELTTLYLKNKKTVDSDDAIKKVFKLREDELPRVQKQTLP